MPDLNQPPLQPFIDAVTPMISDSMDWVTSSISRFAAQAIGERYSVDKPLDVVSDCAGNNTSFIPLPVIATNEDGTTIFGKYVPKFLPRFSTIKSIEYPIGDTPGDYGDPRDWKMYNTPTGYQLQLIACTPANTELVRIVWTARHALDGSTVDHTDFYAVCDFIAVLALEAMAAKAINFGDSTISADVVNYRSKSQEYLSMAKQKRRAYFNHMGIDETDTGVEIGPAVAMGDMKNIMGSGVDRLVHSRNTR